MYNTYRTYCLQVHCRERERECVRVCGHHSWQEFRLEVLDAGTSIGVTVGRTPATLAQSAAAQKGRLTPQHVGGKVADGHVLSGHVFEPYPPRS